MKKNESTILNITFSEREQFIFSFAEKDEYHLSINNMAQAFMKNYPEHDFESEFNNYKVSHPEVNSMELYIARFYFDFQSSLKEEYKAVKKTVKERVEMYKNRVKELNSRIKLTDPHKRGKLEFFMERNQSLLEEATKDSEKKEIFRIAVSKCRHSPPLLFDSRDTKYLDYRQYEDFDIRRIINYGEAPVPIAIESIKADRSQVVGTVFCAAAAPEPKSAK